MIIKTFIWHKFAVVRLFPLDVLIRAGILQPQLCSLRYLKDKQKTLKFGLQICFDCNDNRVLPFAEAAAQVRYIDRVLHDLINWVQVDSVAVLLAVVGPSKPSA